jgi:glycosyltransferase involved in cell wall biosynthesis
MKILIIISGLKTGGAELMLHRVLQHTNPSFIKYNVISLSKSGEVAEKIRLLGINVDEFNFTNSFLSIIEFIKLILKIRDIKPDIVHTWLYHADLIGGVCAKIASVPVIIWNVRNLDVSSDNVKLSIKILARISAIISYLVPNGILYCSNLAMQVHISIGYSPHKSFVIPNGYDISTYKKLKSNKSYYKTKIDLDPKWDVIGVVGRNDPIKNYRGFLISASILYKNNKNIRFIFVGKGLDKNNTELIELAKKYEIKDACIWLGQCNNIPEIMNAFDVFALPSISESFPNVLAEAMSCEVPCVSMDVGEAKSIIGDTGLIVPVQNMKVFAEAIQTILNLDCKTRLALGHKARERIINNFEISKIVNIYNNYYRDQLLQVGNKL